MTRADELGEYGRADPARRSGDEYPHENLLMSATAISLASMSVTVITSHRGIASGLPAAIDHQHGRPGIWTRQCPAKLGLPPLRECSGLRRARGKFRN